MNDKIRYCIVTNPTDKEFEEIENFVQRHPNTSYFQSTLFFKSCLASEKIIPFYILAYQGAKLEGVLLVYKQIQINRPILNFLSSRNIITGGPLVLNANFTIYQELYKAYDRLKLSSIYTQVRNMDDMSNHKELMASLGFIYEEHLNIIVSLEKNEEELWKDVHSKRRNEIRKAEKEGTVFEHINTKDALHDCYTILKEVYARAKLPLPRFNHFEALLVNSNNNDGLKLFVAKHENKIIGCMLCLAYRETLFDYFAGAFSNFYNKYPNDLIPWEVFKWGKKSGYKKFDFGGAGKPNVPYGVREYKKKFGGQMVNYGRFEKVHFPLLFKAVSFGFKLLQKIK